MPKTTALILDLRINLNEIKRRLIENQSRTSYLGVGGVLRAAFLGTLFLSAIPSADSAKANVKQKSPEKSEKFNTTLIESYLDVTVENIALSNERIRKYDSQAGRDFVAVGLAYMKRCEDLKDAQSCMEAGLYIYNKLIPELIIQKKQIPGFTHEDLKVRAIHAFMVQAVNLEPTNPVYLTMMGLALIAENSRNANYDGYDLLLLAYKYNREVAGIAHILAKDTAIHSLAKDLLANNELLTRILDPKDGAYFGNDVVKKGEKELSNFIARRKTNEQNEGEELDAVRQNIM